MEKKTLLALVLIMLVFWISNEFIWKSKPVTETNQPVTNETIEETEEPAELPVEEVENVINESNLEEIQNDIDINNDLVLENDHISIKFSNQGALITSAIVKDFTNKESGEAVQLVPDGQNLFNIKLTDAQGSSHLLTNKVFSYKFIENGQGITFTLPMNGGYLHKTFVIKDRYDIDATIQTESLDLTEYNLKLDSVSCQPPKREIA